MSPTRSILSVVSLAILVVATTRPATAAPSTTTTVTQTVRSLGQNQNGIHGDYLVSYSAITLRSADWSLRSSVSWLSWRDGGGAVSIQDDSGLGSLYLTGGRRLWRARLLGGHGSGWLRVRTKIPLQGEFDVTGSGELDGGAGLFTTYRFGAWTVFGEVGVMNLGEPAGIAYDALFSGSVSLGYRQPGARVYPLIGFAASTAARAGDPSYGEWTLGLGAMIARGTSVSAVYSIGATEISPEHGVAVSISLRP